MDRARVTIPDVAFILFTVALLGALYPVFSDALVQNAGEMSTGVALLLQLVLPSIVLVMLYSLYQKAIRGAKV
jgi:hypothetical protein